MPEKKNSFQKSNTEFRYAGTALGNAILELKGTLEIIWSSLLISWKMRILRPPNLK